MSHPWAVDRGCPASCAARPDPRVPPGELARRYAALAYTLSRAVARGGRLAQPRVLRGEARAVLGALGVRLEVARAEAARLEAVRLEAARGVRLSAGGRGAGTLVVANHISWLDVVALLAVER